MRSTLIHCRMQWEAIDVRRSPRLLFRHGVVRYGLASLLPRGTAILTMLVVTPLGIERLGPFDYGLWVLATQVPNVVVSPDLGLGQGVINSMAHVQRRDGNLNAERSRLHGLVKLLWVIACTWFFVAVGASSIYVVASGTPSASVWPLITAFVVSLACFTSGVPATVFARAQLAQENGHRTVLWEGAGKVLTLVLCVAVLVFSPSLILLVLAYMLPTTLAMWSNAILYAKREFSPASSDPTPSLRQAFQQNKGLFGVGKYFVILQVCYVVGIAADPYIVNAMESTRAVTYISVARRPYEMLPLVVSLYSIALWPVFARLHSAGQWQRLRRLVVLVTAGGTMAVAFAGLLIVAFANPVYSFLGRGQVNPTWADLLWITLHMSATVAVMVVSIYLNAIGVVRIQAVLMVLATTAIVVGKVVVLSIADVHSFIGWASASYVAFTAVPLTSLALRRLRPPAKSEGDAQCTPRPY